MLEDAVLRDVCECDREVVKEMMQQRYAAERETEKIGAKGNKKRDVTLWW